MATATENAVTETIAQQIRDLGGSPILGEAIIILPMQDGQMNIGINEYDHGRCQVDISTELQSRVVDVTEDQTWTKKVEDTIVELIEELIG